MTHCVEVIYFTEDSEDHDLYGPFQSRDKAETHRDRLQERVERLLDGVGGCWVTVRVRTLQQPRIQPVESEIRKMLEDASAG